MDAVAVITEQMDVEAILAHYKFDSTRPDGSMIRACCKIHGGSNASGFIISEETGLWYCHTGGCGGGDIFTLARRMESLSFPQSVRRIAEILGIDINNCTITEQSESWQKELRAFMRMMRDRKKVTKHIPHTLQYTWKNVKTFRAFLPPTLAKFGLKYVASIELTRADNTNYTLKERLLIPIVQNGIEIGVSLRRVNNAHFPKWSHQPASIKTSELLYNIDEYKGDDSIVVVEGIFDVWAFHELGIYAVCTYGAHLSNEQYRILIRTGADIVLCYDGDDAGLVARDKAISMLRNKCNLSYVTWNKESEDPESVAREYLKQQYERRVRVK